jgi:hypothetical protein
MYRFKDAHRGPLEFTQPRERASETISPIIRRLLEANKRYSEQYVADAPQREQWFASHKFRVSCRICSDWRCQFLESALGQRHGHGPGIPAGILKVERSAGAISAFDSHATCMHTLRLVKKCRASGMKLMGPEFAHYSSLATDTASCAAFNHDTAAALRVVTFNAGEFNYAYRGTVVAFPCLYDTDTGSIKVYGPDGRWIDTIQVAKDRSLMKLGPIATKLRGMINDVLPESWEPLAALDAESRSAFAYELAQHLAMNVVWVRRRRKHSHETKLLTHEERLLVFGRRVAPLTDMPVFLISDHGSHQRLSFCTGLKFVYGNTLADAIRADDRAWTTPIFMNTACDDVSRRIMRLNIRHSRERLEAYASDTYQDAKTYILDEHLRTRFRSLPSWVKDDLNDKDRFMSGLSWCLSVSGSDWGLRPFS